MSRWSKLLFHAAAATRGNVSENSIPTYSHQTGFLSVYSAISVVFTSFLAYLYPIKDTTW